jgi:hypothetical protein
MTTHPQRRGAELSTGTVSPVIFGAAASTCTANSEPLLKPKPEQQIFKDCGAGGGTRMVRVHMVMHIATARTYLADK